MKDKGKIFVEKGIDIELFLVSGLGEERGDRIGVVGVFVCLFVCLLVNVVEEIRFFFFYGNL